MLDEIRANGGCLQLLVLSVTAAFIGWLFVALVLMTLGQVTGQP